jgi:hypothetical protein
MITAKGHTGQVTFDGNFVTITRKGALSRVTVGKGEKRIPISSITAVQWKEPGGLVNGFIQFTVMGGNESRSRFGSQTMDAVNDENSVVVTKKQAADFGPLREAVEAAIVARHQPQQVVVAPAAAPPSKFDQLRQLGELRDAGVLSDAEFEVEKVKILGTGAGDSVAPITMATESAPVSASSPAPASAPVATAVAEPPVPADDAAEGERVSDDEESRSGKAGRVGLAVATAGWSEVGRFAKKRLSKGDN